MTFNFFIDPGCTDLYKDPGMLLCDPVLRTPGSGLYITDQESRVNNQQPSTINHQPRLLRVAVGCFEGIKVIDDVVLAHGVKVCCLNLFLINKVP